MYLEHLCRFVASRSWGAWICRYLTAMAAILCGAAIANGLEFDFNGDGDYTCSDAELLQEAFREQRDDPRFDVDQDGMVTRVDLDSWLNVVAVANEVFIGTIFDGDLNLDGVQTHREFHIVAANSSERLGYELPVSGWCAGDFNGDGIVLHGEVNQAGFINRFPPELATVQQVAEPIGRGEIFARTSQYELIAYPQPSVDGLALTRIAARMLNPTDDIVSIDLISAEGPLHQIAPLELFGVPWVDQHGKTLGSAWLIPFSEGYPPEYDTHMIIEDFEGGRGFIETVDESDPFDLQTLLAESGLNFVAGLGNTTILGPFHPRRIAPPRELDIMQLARPLDEEGDVTFSIRIQGVDGDNAILPDIGRVEDVLVPFGVASECDFDHNRLCNVEDLDVLVKALGTENQSLDLTHDSAVLTDADVDRWLELATADRGWTVVRGDANLDGRIDAVDLNTLARNWEQPGDYGWSGGDFNGDGNATASDLNQIATRWQFPANEGQVAAVPEPATNWFLLLGLVVTLHIRPCRDPDAKRRAHSAAIGQ